MKESVLKTTNIIVISLAAVVLLLAVGVMISSWGLRQIDDAVEARRHTSLVIDRGDELLSLLRATEADQRGYLLTGDENFLKQYRKACENAFAHLEELSRIVLIPAAKEHLDVLAPMMDVRLAEMSRVIELHRNHDMIGVKGAVSESQGIRLTDSILPR